ncbi:MAG TPA: response regulator [Candidatus Nanoarchaeia archaeon]|nr:response regulator [Candidatus Nanoarchaeia archaeon]
MSKPRILVVDDRRSVLWSYYIILKNDAEVVRASSYSEGIERLREPHLFNGAIVDLHPHQDGLSGLDIARVANELYQDIPLFIITGGSTSQFFSAASQSVREHPNIEVILKPFEPYDFQRRILEKTKAYTPKRK